MKEPLPREQAEVVIIGGGVMGLGLAYNLARLGLSDVMVLERSYLCYGASGRNGGGIRAQWSTEDNIRLMKRSVALCKAFAREMRMNIWFRQGGYLFLVQRPEILAAVEQNVALQNRCGVATRLLEPAEAARIVPELRTDGIVGAAYNPDDGVVFPWPFVWGYAQRAKALGATVHPFTEVTGFETAAGKITGVLTDRGRVASQIVVNATGAWSPELAKLAGVDLPNRPYRHEILVTESLKPFLGPMVSLLGTGLYFSQSMRGEIVGGMGDPDEPEGLSFESSFDFATRFAAAATALLPRLAGVRVLRQWAGCYDVSPDHHPIVGETPGLSGFLQLVGFGGHGFMMAPAITEALARWITGGDKDPFFDRYTAERFSNGREGFASESMIIG